LDGGSARPKASTYTHRTTQTQNKLTQCRHQCLEWDSNPRSQRPSERKQFILLDSAANVIGIPLVYLAYINLMLRLKLVELHLSFPHMSSIKYLKSRASYCSGSEEVPQLIIDPSVSLPYTIVHHWPLF
jgi:hypothetical protein